MLQVAACGAPLQESASVPFTPGVPLKARLYVAVCPAVTEAEVEELEAAPAAKSRVPVNVTACGLFGPVNLNGAGGLRRFIQG